MNYISIKMKIINFYYVTIADHNQNQYLLTKKKHMVTT